VSTDDQLSPIGRFERILLASDGSEYCADAERVALAMTEKCGGTLQLVSVAITNPAAEEVAPELMQAAEQESRALLDRLHEEAVKRGIASETILRRGLDPYVEIVTAAEKNGSDVIVMGRRGKRGLMQRMIGDATSKVVGRAKCSVLVVPEGAGMWQTRILLATDGSRFSDAAAVAAARIASLCKVAVTVISTVRESFSEERAAQADDAATRVHDHLAERGIEVDKVVLRGNPEKLILETAAARGADLIVMGTHGRTGWERVMVGSVAASVIAESKVPVLAVKL
jgi:nucleotide-binding universal stress UspA family protein